jgi:hypothetical protein
MRWLLSAVFLAAWFQPGLLRADEPHLDLVRGLRARGMADLALDYLQRLSANPPAGLRTVLPLEIAKTRMELAVNEFNERKRDRRIVEARAAFDSFIQADPKHPLVAEATLDLARLVAFQGKHLLTQARRADDAPTRTDLIKRARPLFTDAAARLAAAATQIDELLARTDDPTLKKSLAQSKLQAHLESGINRLHVALTMPDNNGAQIKARAHEIDKARAALEVLATGSEDSPFCWLARLWIARCLDERDSDAEARRMYESLAQETNPASEEAARIASFLLLKEAAEDKQSPHRADQLKAVITGLEEWLLKYRGKYNFADEQAAQFLLAVVMEEQALAGVERDRPGSPTKINAGVAQELARVERLLKQIADADGDYAERARNRRGAILVLLLGERAGDVSRLVNFEECFLAAQVEAFQLTQGRVAGADRAKSYSRIAALLRRGLVLVGRSDSARDVADARAMLAYTYLASGDPYAAAVYGEHVGKSKLAGSRSPEVTAYALQAYSSIIALGRERHETDEQLKADQRRLRQLAQYMEQTWPDETATDFARHQLGTFLLDDHNFVEACAMLGRIAPSYPGVAQARYQQGAAAQRAQAKDVPLSPEQKRKLLRESIAGLEQLPEPTPGGSDDAALALCMAKCQLGNLYLFDDSANGANFVKAAELGKRLAEVVPTLGLDSKVSPQLLVEANKLYLAGAQNRAFLLVQADQLDAARAILQPIFERVRKEIEIAKPPQYAGEPWYEGYRDVQRQVIALNLRLAIQENQSEAAHQALALLRRASGQLENTNDRLLRLVYDLKREADEHKKKGEIEKRDKLEKGLVAFLDELAKPKLLADDVRLFLAQAYGGLGRHDRAANLLEGYPAPANGSDEQRQRHHGVRLMLAREHRLAQQIESAKTVLQEILGSWGRNDLSVRREKVLLLEDAGNFGAAVQECREIKRSLLQARIDYDRAVRDEKLADEAERAAKTDDARQKAAQDRATAQAKKNGTQSMRDRYWEFDFYDTRIVLRSCQKVTDPATREQKIAAVAQNIRRLEEAYPDVVGKELRDQYLSLFELEPILKAKYLQADGKVLASS